MASINILDTRPSSLKGPILREQVAGEYSPLKPSPGKVYKYNEIIEDNSRSLNGTSNSVSKVEQNPTLFQDAMQVVVLLNI